MSLTMLLDDRVLRTRAGARIPCQESDPELWFDQTPEGVEFAKTLCTTCPVREACLAGAFERREPWGVWGGELFLAGRVVARKRPRGRPRKQRPAETDPCRTDPVGIDADSAGSADAFDAA